MELPKFLSQSMSFLQVRPRHFMNLIQYTNKSISNEQNKALPTHGNNTLREFGGKIKTNRELFFFTVLSSLGAFRE